MFIFLIMAALINAQVCNALTSLSEKEAQKLQEESYKKTSQYFEETKKLESEVQDKISDYVKESNVLMAKSISVINEDLKEFRIEVSDEKYRRLVFISLSMPEKVLETIINQAKIHHFVPVLRGFMDGSYVKTAEFLQNIIKKTEYGVVIDPESFKEFDVIRVPTFVLSELPKDCLESQSCLKAKYHKIAGNISFEYVVEKFMSNGFAS